MSGREQLGGTIVAERPHMPGYGVSDDGEGMLTWGFVDERVSGARNYWVGTTRSDGRPHAAPVWGVWVEGTLYFGTSRRSRKGRNLAADPRLVVHLESGNEAVMFEGVAEEVDGPVTLAAVGAAYGEKYGIDLGEAGSDGSVWYALRPSVAYAWVERDFPNTATRWIFGNG